VQHPQGIELRGLPRVLRLEVEYRKSLMFHKHLMAQPSEANKIL